MAAAAPTVSVEAALLAALRDAPAPPRALAYGTAGFRADAALLDGVFVRCGALAALRSLALARAHGGVPPVVGAMITASHNEIGDNGVKMIDPDGGMMAPAWEKHATTLAAALTPEAAAAAVAAIAAAEGVAWPPTHAAVPRVHVAMDTRPHSARLKGCLVAGAAALGGVMTDHGLLSTPQLHHIVRMVNAGEAGDATAAGWASEAGYYAMLADAYRALTAEVSAGGAARGPLHLDCAHGVGAPKAQLLAAALGDALTILPRNLGDTPAAAAALNAGVGAEYAQKERKPPAGFSAAADAGARCASLDGDADRLVYHYYDTGAGAWHLLDGDKIATLAAAFLADQLRALGWTITKEPTHVHHDDAGHHHAAPAPAPAPGTVSVGIVQTAYANGASTAYVAGTLHLPVVMAKTGVKYVHHAATAYDVGVYFEANGHGTVLFHPDFLAALRGMATDGLSPPAAAARRRLLAAAQLINQAIGDALSDALFVEAVLALKGWSVVEWDGVYADLPSRQSKMAVPDRSAVVTTPDETRVVSPAPLQDAIDAAAARVPSGRAFVRPSGTEDVVRLYAEAATEAAAAELASAVAAAVSAHLR